MPVVPVMTHSLLTSGVGSTGSAALYSSDCKQQIQCSRLYSDVRYPNVSSKIEKGREEKESRFEGGSNSIRLLKQEPRQLHGVRQQRADPGGVNPLAGVQEGGVSRSSCSSTEKIGIDSPQLRWQVSQEPGVTQQLPKVHTILWRGPQHMVQQVLGLLA